MQCSSHPGVGLYAGVQLAYLEKDAEHPAPRDMRVRVAGLQLQEDDLRRAGHISDAKCSHK